MLRESCRRSPLEVQHQRPAIAEPRQRVGLRLVAAGRTASGRCRGRSERGGRGQRHRQRAGQRQGKHVRPLEVIVRSARPGRRRRIRSVRRWYGERCSLPADRGGCRTPRGAPLDERRSRPAGVAASCRRGSCRPQTGTGRCCQSRRRPQVRRRSSRSPVPIAPPTRREHAHHQRQEQQIADRIGEVGDDASRRAFDPPCRTALKTIAARDRGHPRARRSAPSIQRVAGPLDASAHQQHDRGVGGRVEERASRRPPVTGPAPP